MSGREIYTLLSLLEVERDFPATAGTGPVLTHRGRLGPFGVAVFEKHPKIGKSEYYWEKKKCIFFFCQPHPECNQNQKTAHLVLGLGGFGEAQEAQSGLGEGQPWWGEPWGCPWGGLSSSGAVHGQKAASTTSSRGCSRLAGPLLPQEQLSQGGE